MRRRFLFLLLFGIFSTVAVAQTADLNVTVSDVPDPVQVGGELRYRITVSNLGPDDANNVTLGVSLDWQLTFLSAIWSQGNCTPGSFVECELGDLSAGSSADVRVFAIPTTLGTVTTNIDVRSDTGDPDFGNNSKNRTTTVTASPADISVTMVADPDPVAVGEELRFIITVTNLGPGTASNVELRATQPSGLAGLDLELIAGTGFSCSYGGSDPLWCDLDSFGVGTSTVLALKGRAAAEGTLSSTAFVSGNVADSDSSNNTATATATATEALIFDLGVSKVGGGTGTVVSDTEGYYPFRPTEIECGAICSTEAARGTSIELTAVPDPGSVFSGWDGPCTGSDACTLTMEADEIVTATFSRLAMSIVTPGAATPPASSEARIGATDVPMLQFTITPDAASENVTLAELTFSASGTGDDVENIVAVRVYRDNDGNGELNNADAMVAIGSYREDNGEVTLALGTPLMLTHGDATSFVVTYDLGNLPAIVTASGEITPDVPTAGVGLPPTLALLFPLVFLGTVTLRRSRKLRIWLLLATAAVVLSACAQELVGTPPPSTLPPPTHQVHLTALSLTGMDSAEGASISGLPVSGTVLTIQD